MHQNALFRTYGANSDANVATIFNYYCLFNVGFLPAMSSNNHFLTKMAQFCSHWSMTLNIWKGYWVTELEEIKDTEAYFQK